MDTPEKIDPAQLRPLRSIVITRRAKPESETVTDKSASRVDRDVRIAYESQESSSLVLACTSSDVTRAVVLASGPKSTIPAGCIVGIPGHKQDSPVMRDVDANGETWEGWHENQIHYVAEWV